MKYRFISYYKYAFTLELENGKRITNENQGSDDIYRLEISEIGEATEQKREDNSIYWLVDGCEFS